MTITPDMPPHEDGEDEPRKKINKRKVHIETPLTAEEKTALDAIIAREWQAEPKLFDMLDPGIKMIIAQVSEAEDALANFSTEGDTSSCAGTMITLNNRYRELGLKSSVMTVSGKLRLARDQSGDAKLPYLALESDCEYIAGQLGEPKTDVLGEYYVAQGVQLRAGAFEFDELEFKDSENNVISSCAMIAFGFVPLDYPDEDDPLLYMYKEDIEYIAPSFRSSEGALETLKEFYPEIIEMIEMLPDSCLNLRDVVKGIRNFQLAIDMSKIKEFDNLSELKAAIEAYIIQRLNPDNADYQFVVRGQLGTFTADGNIRTVHKRLPRFYRLRMTNVQLVPTEHVPNEAEDIIVYRLAVGAYMPVPEDGGGAIPIVIPSESLLAIRRTRPRSLPFHFDTAINHTITCEDDWTQYVRPIDGEEFDDANAIESEAVLLDIEADREVRASQMIAETEALESESFFEYAKAMELQIQNYLSLAQEICSQPFETTSDRDTARNLLENTYRVIAEKYQARPFIMQVRGQGLIFSNVTPSATFDDTANRLMLTLENTAMDVGDITTTKEGALEDASFLESGTAPNEYSLMAVLRFLDLPKSGPLTNVVNSDGELTYISVSQQTYFFAQLRDSVEIQAKNSESLLEQGLVVSELMKIIESGSDSPDVKLPVALYKEVREASTSGFTQSIYIDELRQLAESVKDDVGLSEVFCQRVAAAVGRGCSLMLSGDVYDVDGGVEKKTVTGKLVDIIPRMRRIPQGGPLIVLQNDAIGLDGEMKSSTWFVPMARMIDFKI